MGPFVEGGLGGVGQRFLLRDPASVSQVREAVREEAQWVGLSKVQCESLVTAASELGHNQLAHAGLGEMAVRRIRRGTVAGVEVLALDRGPGIADPVRALGDQPAGPSPLAGEAGPPRGGRGGLGIGLSGVYRLADEVDFDVRRQEGTFIAARKFIAAVPRQEVAVLGRPYPGEAESGDDAFFAWTAGDLHLAVADGLGHGSLARDASRRAVAAAAAKGDAPLIEGLEAAHAAATGTRGTVLALVRFTAEEGGLCHAGVGNVSAHLQQGRQGRRFLVAAGFLGASHSETRRHSLARRAPEERVAIGHKDVLLMFTDGLTSRLDLGAHLDLLREPPLVVAHRLLAQYGRDNDDALLLVARL